MMKRMVKQSTQMMKQVTLSLVGKATCLLLRIIYSLLANKIHNLKRKAECIKKINCVPNKNMRHKYSRNSLMSHVK